MLNNTFVLDTSALLKGSEQIFSILKKQKLRAIIPSIVIEELDNIKDNPSHKENRGAHKVLQHIHAFETKEISKRKREQGVKNDTLIMQCAKELNAWIISEDKTFSIQYERVLTIADFRDKFESYNENIPDSIAKELFCTLIKRDFAKAQEIAESSKNTPWKINAYDDKGFTPLIYAVQASCATLVEALLYHSDVDLHKCDNAHLKMTPLAHAVQKDNIQIASMLLKSGAKAYIGNKGKNKANTPFLMACWDNRANAIDMLELLYSNGISLNQVDSNGFSGLIKAAIKGHKRIIEWLLDKGVDIDLRDFEGKNALEHAMQDNKKRQDIVNILKRHYAK